MARLRNLAGFTLVELGLVVAVIALVAAIASQRFVSLRRDAQVTAAEAEMAEIRAAFMGSAACAGLLQDMENIPGWAPEYLRMANLLTPTNFFVSTGSLAREVPAGTKNCAPAAAFERWDASAGRGWHGPYLRKGDQFTPFPAPGASLRKGEKNYRDKGFFPDIRLLALPRNMREKSAAYGFAGEPSIPDPWGNPYVLQIPPPQAFVTSGGILAPVSGPERFRYARIVSAGPDGEISTPCYFGNTNSAASSWDAATRRASIFGGRTSDRGDDLVLFLSRADEWFQNYEREGDAR
jgi:type II secretory pathway pseudopilin PulG